MAYLTIANGYIPKPYADMSYLLTTRISNLVQSGIVSASPKMDELMAGGGNVFELPFWNDLDYTVGDRRPTVPETASVLHGGAADPLPQNITSGVEIFAKICRNQSWGVTDMSDSILLNGDPMNFLISRSAFFLSLRLQDYLLNVLKGIFAAGDTAFPNSFTLDISNAAGGAFSPGQTTFSAAAHIKVLQFLGERKGDLKVILMNSFIESTIALQDLIETVHDSQGQVLFTKFMNMRIVINDLITEVSSGVYDTYYFGLNTFWLGHKAAKVPLEEDRHPGASNGGGETVFYRRWEWALHPRRFKVQGAMTLTGAGPTDAELIVGTNWGLTSTDRKHYTMARIRSREA